MHWLKRLQLESGKEPSTPIFRSQTLTTGRSNSRSEKERKKKLDIEDLSVESNDSRLAWRGPFSKLAKGMRLFYRVLKFAPENRTLN